MVLVESSQILVILVDGLALGFSIFLASLGLAIVFGMLRIVNFAHGSFFMWGAYLGFYTAAVTGNFALGLAISFASITLLGIVAKLTLLRNEAQDLLSPVMITIGLMFILDRLALLVWGETTMIWSPNYLEGTINMGGVILYKYRLFLIIAGAMLFTAIYVLVNRTRIGLIVRAGIEDREMVELLGIDFKRLSLLVFATGAGLAGLSGFLFVPWIGVNPGTGTTFLLYAFVVVVLGGVGNIVGTVAASLTTGILQQITMYYAPWLTEAILFVLMLIVLLIRPEGLMR